MNGAPDAAHHLRLAASVLDAFDRVGERLAVVARRIVEHVADGLAREFGVVERQFDAGQQDAAGLLLDHRCGRGGRHAGALDEPLLLAGDEGVSRLVLLSGAKGVGRPAAFSLSRVCFSTTVSGGQAARESSTPPSTTSGLRPATSWLSGGSTTGGPSNTSRSGLRPSDRRWSARGAGRRCRRSSSRGPRASISRGASSGTCSASLPSLITT